MRLANYLRRIALARTTTVDLTTLAMVMAAHSRAIAFENIDVVLGKPISMTADDVERKLVDEGRGGYCWEQNTLLASALSEIGFDVTPLLCRVRWNKPDDSAEPNTTYTHMALKVGLGGATYLADVGFAGSNSMAPVSLDVGTEPQALPEGDFRVVPSKHADFHVLELEAKGEWRPLYEWRDERAAFVDQECGNFFSYAYPTARFTTSFFACRIVGDERHHILNGDYVVRKGHGVVSSVTTKQIADKTELLSLINGVFGVRLAGDTEGIDRYLPKS